MKTIEAENLNAIHDARKSFYGKAKVVYDNGTTKLYSYDTLVCYIDEKNQVTVIDTFSSTTLRHIKEFLLQNGFNAENKKQIEKDYIK